MDQLANCESQYSIYAISQVLIKVFALFGKLLLNYNVLINALLLYINSQIHRFNYVRAKGYVNYRQFWNMSKDVTSFGSVVDPAMLICDRVAHSVSPSTNTLQQQFNVNFRNV